MLELRASAAPDQPILPALRRPGLTGRQEHGGEWMDWLPASGAPHLASDEVHVWRFTLDLEDAQIERMAGLLAPDETERAGRLRFERDQARFIARRGWLRLILSQYIGTSPAALRYHHNQHGRPALANSPLAFNASHSAGLGLAAVSWHAPLGVDIERIRPEVAHTDISRRFFSPAEQAQLAALPPGEQALAFFLCWTRKEAYLKALGMGLSLPLDRFDVTLRPGEPARLLAARDGLPGPQQLSLFHLEPGQGHVGALCASANKWTVRLLDAEPGWIDPNNYS